ncbi:MAG: hypothetical protein K1X63_15760 [Chitinophagales bacterium]|nr:hypothetical protein [Chitinophagales bacterium]
MKKVLLSGLIAAFVLLIVSVGVLYFTVYFFPNLALEYYDPAFRSSSKGTVLYFVHPFILSFALAWFWDRFKTQFDKPRLLKELEFGLVYLVVATLPSMWMIYSAMSVTIEQVGTWLLYGFIQAVIAAAVFVRVNP